MYSYAKNVDRRRPFTTCIYTKYTCGKILAFYLSLFETWHEFNRTSINRLRIYDYSYDREIHIQKLFAYVKQFKGQ